MTYDAEAATAAITLLDAAEQQLRSLVPRWPEVAPGEVTDRHALVEALNSVDEATEKVRAIFRAASGGQYGPTADHGDG